MSKTMWINDKVVDNNSLIKTDRFSHTASHCNLRLFVGGTALDFPRVIVWGFAVLFLYGCDVILVNV